MATNPPAGDQGAGSSPGWLVPRVDEPVRALVRLPGSKSMTTRSLVLAAALRSVTVGSAFPGFSTYWARTLAPAG